MRMNYADTSDLTSQRNKNHNSRFKSYVVAALIGIAITICGIIGYSNNPDSLSYRLNTSSGTALKESSRELQENHPDIRFARNEKYGIVYRDRNRDGAWNPDEEILARVRY